MKKYVWMLGIFFTGMSLWSCSNDDDYTRFQYVARGIDSIAMPDSARLGNRVEIRTFTSVLQGCEQFQSLDWDIVGNERTVTAWFVKYDDLQCGESLPISPFVYFNPQAPGNYHIRFWAGQDEVTQEDVFITQDIVIY